MKLFHTLFLLLFVSPVLAADVYFYEVSSEINTDGTSSNRISFVLAPNASDFDFIIYSKVLNFKFESSFSGVECLTEDNILGTQVRCTGLEQDAENRVLKMSYETVSYTRTEEKRGVFNANYKVPFPVDSASVAVKLPEGFVLAQGEGFSSFSPQDGVITSDGQRIITQWFRSNIASEQDLTFSVVYEDRRPPALPDLSRVVVISFVLVAIFGVVMYMVLRNKDKEHAETILEVLTKDEKHLINIIKESNGSIIQKKIVDSTDYSKAKVSRILKDLQTRGIVTIEPKGRENMVYLTKKIK